MTVGHNLGSRAVVGNNRNTALKKRLDKDQKIKRSLSGG
jgi:hypothetical protein